MKCAECKKEANESDVYCGSCGSILTSASRCRRCRYPLTENAVFCVNCGLRHISEEHDDSFLENIFKRCLGAVRRRNIGFTHLFMRLSSRLICVEENGWAAEECAYLIGIFFTYGILVLNSPEAFHANFPAWLLVVYAAYRLLDIISYELGIVFIDRHQNMVSRGGHLLSIDRRVLCLFIHLLDFIGCYALLYLAITTPGCDSAFSDGGLKSGVESLYFSVIVASFTGLSRVNPVSSGAQLLVMSEILFNLVLTTILVATVVGSLDRLTEMKPRPLPASRIFGRRNSVSGQGEDNNDQPPSNTAQE